MDDLQFRRQAYGDPNSQDEAFLSAINDDSDKAAFVADLKSLDNKLAQALKVEVPEDLSAKLLLNQQLQQHNRQRRASGYSFAFAASIAFLAGITFALLRLTPVNLSQHALAHVAHEAKAFNNNTPLAIEQVNYQLASIKGLENNQFSSAPADVLYSTYCDFQGVRSLHLVVQGEHGKVTVFVTPMEDRMTLDSQFANAQLQGQGFITNNTYMLLVGENANDFTQVKQEIKQSFI